MKTRKIKPFFVYLIFLAAILVSIVSLIITSNFTGFVTLQKEEIGVLYNNEEISMHNVEEDCWISINDMVYDITLFLQIYPDKNLRQKCGKQVEAEFFDEEAKVILEQYKIGKLR